MAERIGTSATREDLIVAYINVAGCRVYQFNKFVISGIAHAVAIGIARRAVWRISQKLIYQNIPQRVATELNAGGITVTAISSHHQINIPGAAQVCGNQYMHLVQARQIRGRND